ncbi:MAG TPA: diaminopimelate decarboxylase [Candidatus Hydrogenedentes bacterium]|nr:diaminopimelate decarboxylase [Candidatus Hydrogenedentota bacterium]
MSSTLFLSPEQAFSIRESFGTPVFVYDQRILEEAAQAALSFPTAWGLTVRFAMKALPTAAVLQVFHRAGLHLDASSGYEAERAMLAGVPAEHIQITAQELPANLKELVTRGCLFNACSLRQLDVYGGLFPGTEVSVRVNPGLGSGHSNRANVGGPSSSFGVWHERLDEVTAIARKRRLRLTGMHTHIGSGADPKVWLRCATLALSIAARLPEVTRLSLGGGFKPARMDYETGADLAAIGAKLQPAFETFARDHGRKLRLELEPGALLTANAGALVCSVTDVVDTGKDGFRFIKTDTGMTDILRPSLYGAQHPITLFPATARGGGAVPYLVVGHCCESGDLLSPEPGNPEGLQPRDLPTAEAGDLLVIGGAGAYCAGMAAKNYNSFPESSEVLLNKDGVPRLIRARQTLAQMVQNEVSLP